MAALATVKRRLDCALLRGHCLHGSPDVTVATATSRAGRDGQLIITRPGRSAPRVLIFVHRRSWGLLISVETDLDRVALQSQ